MMVSHKLLLQTASVDALARLRASVLGRQNPETRRRAFKVYFEEQQHFSIADFLRHRLSAEHRSKECLVSEGGALLQVCLLERKTPTVIDYQ